MTRREQGTGSVYEDKKHPGRWIGEVRIAGKRRRVSGHTKQETSRKLRELTAKRDTGQKVANRSVTVANTITKFLERDVPDRSARSGPGTLAPKTVELYKWTGALIVAEIGTVRLADLTVADIEEMLDRLADRDEKPLGRSSLIKVRGTLQRAIAFAIDRREAVWNPALAAKIPKQARRSETRRALGPGDARTLLAALRDERNGLMFALSLRLGLRPGEAAALYWTDIERDVVNVTRGLRRVGGRPVIVSEMKTEQSRRTIGMPADLVEWVDFHRRQQTEEREASTKWADERLVFATTAGTAVDPTKERRRLAAICERAGVPIVRPNELRHSCASLLSDAGVPLELIADLLGHETTDMLDRTYRHRLRPVVDVAARTTWAETSPS